MSNSDAGYISESSNLSFETSASRFFDHLSNKNATADSASVHGNPTMGEGNEQEFLLFDTSFHEEELGSESSEDWHSFVSRSNMQSITRPPKRIEAKDEDAPQQNDCRQRRLRKLSADTIPRTSSPEVDLEKARKQGNTAMRRSASLDLSALIEPSGQLLQSIAGELAWQSSATNDHIQWLRQQGLNILGGKEQGSIERRSNVSSLKDSGSNSASVTDHIVELRSGLRDRDITQDDIFTEDCPSHLLAHFLDRRRQDSAVAFDDSSRHSRLFKAQDQSQDSARPEKTEKKNAYNGERQAISPCASIRPSKLKSLESHASTSAPDIVKNQDLSSWGARFWCAIEEEGRPAWYANPETGECSWSLPRQAFLVPFRPKGVYWMLHDQWTGMDYYYHTLTKRTQWIIPTEDVVIPMMKVQKNIQSQQIIDTNRVHDEKPSASNTYFAPDNHTQVISRAGWDNQHNSKSESERSRPLSQSSEVKEVLLEEKNIPLDPTILSRQHKQSFKSLRICTGSYEQKAFSESSPALSSLRNSSSEQITNSQSGHVDGSDVEGRQSRFQKWRWQSQRQSRSHLQTTRSEARPHIVERLKKSISMATFASDSAEHHAPLKRIRDPIRRNNKARSPDYPCVPDISLHNATPGPQISDTVLCSDFQDTTSEEADGKIASDMFIDYARAAFTTKKRGLLRKRPAIEELTSWQRTPIREPLHSFKSSGARRDAVKAFTVTLRAFGLDEENKGTYVTTSRVKKATRKIRRRPKWRHSVGPGRQAPNPKSAIHQPTVLIEEVKQLIEACNNSAKLTNEVFAQALKQLHHNPSPVHRERGWVFMGILLTFLTPDDMLRRVLQAFTDERIRHLVKEAHDRGAEIIVGFAGALHPAAETSSLRAAEYCAGCLAQYARYGICSRRASTIADLAAAQEAIFEPQVFFQTLQTIMTRQTKRYPEEIVPIALIFLSEALLRCGATVTPGVFRTTAPNDKVALLRARLNTGRYSLAGLTSSIDEVSKTETKNVEDQQGDVALLASVLKLWLSELRVPLIPPSFYQRSIDCCQNTPEIMALCLDLPRIHFRTLMFLVSFLQLFCDDMVVARTGVGYTQLADIFAPCLLRCPEGQEASAKRRKNEERKFVEKLLLELPVDSLAPNFGPHFVEDLLH